MSIQYRWGRWLIGFAAIFLFTGQLLADAPKLRVLTTIKPLQLIAIAVLGDNAAVEVLLDPNISPHDYQMRPSTRSKLERADVLLWIGPAMETFLMPVISSLPRQVKVMSLQAETGQTGDPHLWMDPLIAAAMGHKIADALTELAPTYDSVWHANATQLEKELLTEDRRLLEQFSAIKSPRGYMVAHDAYSRFEARYGLQHRAALTDIADLPPSAQHIARIQAQLDAGEISCVMQEPFMPPKILQTLLRGRQVRVVTIDSLALEESTLGDFYRALGTSVRKCLQP